MASDSTELAGGGGGDGVPSTIAASQVHPLTSSNPTPLTSYHNVSISTVVCRLSSTFNVFSQIHVLITVFLLLLTLSSPSPLSIFLPPLPPPAVLRRSPLLPLTLPLSLYPSPFTLLPFSPCPPLSPPPFTPMSPLSLPPPCSTVAVVRRAWTPRAWHS